MPVRAGVIGVGIMGALHAQLLCREISRSEVAAVYDVDEQRTEAVAHACGARAMDDPMVLIKDESVDCVLIASSDETHEQFVLAALAADKPVLCEKPLAPDPLACQRILAAEAEKPQPLVSLGFMRRFDTGYLALRSDLRAGSVGAPLLLHCVHRNAAAGTIPSETLISGSLVHEIDVARWLLGEELVSVTIHTPRPSARSGGSQDPLVAILRTASGALVDTEVFVNAGYGYDVRCEVVGEAGTLVLDSPAPTARQAQGAVTRPVPADWRGRFADAYRRELQQWIDAVANGGVAPLASAWDGYVATVVADAGIRALRTGTTQEIVLPDRRARNA